ncbi:amino acid permease [Corynebacterium terpenotabidum]|uniref:GABA permease n=1 Tax=Corynebacterium terpenotabidum Y-11 TaxID=1200352 RepID=S4XM41_9CORY|nr:amino acid permease [Corynebacterium terpenotabidum]AGP31703.1 GABA permease [Corynebacterium terpenotabidum Y-11]
MSGTPQELGQGLKPRHVTMLSLAGAIGAGLFVGSATAIDLAGPAVILAYIAAAGLVVLVMRMLGEMATANPDSGSFSTYADRAIGHWAGFSIGWLYWWFWVLVIPVEATAAAAILHSWFGAVPLWVFALLVTIALTATNLFSVKNYGEFEYWFALLKVAAIIAFIAIGALAFVGVFGTDHAGPSNLWDHGGFVPNGWGAVPAALLTTMFSFMGTEIVTIAAAESANPAGQIRKATNSVIFRLGLFYIVSIFLIICIVPWNDPTLLADGSFLATLNVLNIPGAKFMVDFVVLVAVASCMNSSLYTASRMMFSLARRGDAPKVFSALHVNGVPVPAVLLSTTIGFLAVIGNYVMPDRLFTTLLATSGAVALLVYLSIAVSQLVTRNNLKGEAPGGLVKMWAFPYLTWLVIIAIPAVLLYMAIWSDMKTELWSTAILTAVVVATGVYIDRKRKRKADAPSVTGTDQKTATVLVND